MTNITIAILTAIVASASWISTVQGQCLPHDSTPPKCYEWISDPNNGEPVFIEHIYNCSRFWVCQPDLTDCLHECAPMGDGGALYFDVRDQYPIGPTCNWPEQINCTMKDEDCSICHPWQKCILPGPICTPDCKIDTHCQDDEYCDFKEGGEGNCHKGCRTGSTCDPCGDCVDHKCPDLECCTNEDCHGLQCVDGRCKCVEDDDCESNEYCDKPSGECLEGCRDDASCVDNGVCATCGDDHKCSEPECCADDDCQADCAFAECQDDFTCSTPECCDDTDCEAGEKCEEGVCTGCKADSDCEGHDKVCDNDYTNCQFCDIEEGNAAGSCSPGCATDENCNGQCNGNHKCFQPGDNVLNAITFTTASCSGCQGTLVEQGVVMHLLGDVDIHGQTHCHTDHLDNKNIVDYKDGVEAEFTSEETLKHCHYYNLQGRIEGGNVTWTQDGTWTVQGKKITFHWSDVNALANSCCLSVDQLSPASPTAQLTKCGKDFDNGSFTC